MESEAEKYYRRKNRDQRAARRFALWVFVVLPALLLATCLSVPLDR